MDTPVSESRPAELRAATAPTFKFVFCEHTAENTKAIAEAVSDCDVIAFEGVGLASRGHRDKSNEVLTYYLSDEIIDNHRGEIEDVLRDINVDGVLLGVLSSFSNSNKKVVVVDINEDNKDYVLVEKNRAGYRVRYSYGRARRSWSAVTKNSNKLCLCSVRRIKSTGSACRSTA